MREEEQFSVKMFSVLGLGQWVECLWGFALTGLALSSKGNVGVASLDTSIPGEEFERQTTKFRPRLILLLQRIVKISSLQKCQLTKVTRQRVLMVLPQRLNDQQPIHGVAEAADTPSTDYLVRKKWSLGLVTYCTCTIETVFISVSKQQRRQ